VHARDDDSTGSTEAAKGEVSSEYWYDSTILLCGGLLMPNSGPHTPESLGSAGVIGNPYPAYADLRESSPFVFSWLPALAPAPTSPVMSWALMRYRDAFSALRDHQTFSSANNPVVELGLSQKITLLQDDPPVHSKLRRVVNRAFTSASVEALEPMIKHLIDELIADLAGRDNEIISSLAMPLPMMVIASILGIPAEDYRSFRKWSEAFMSLARLCPDSRQSCVNQMVTYFRQTIAHGRSRRAGVDLIGDLLDGQVDNERLTESELVGFCILLLIAGNETTTNLIGNMLNVLADRPLLWQLLKVEPVLIDSFINETLRFESPVQRLSRRATRDVVMSGKTIRKGDIVTVFYGAANRDAQVFPDPDEFKLERDFRDSLAFGAGIHYCLGSLLARLEARLLLESLLTKYETASRGAGPTRRQVQSFTVLGFEELSITFS
jgi:cytochrome P450